ncbi:MAG: VOC family protein [Phycisphaeraceae bacterium]|nr:VOC family protein [Phycisphaeraceae bacterium]
MTIDISEIVLVVDDVPACADFYEYAIGMIPDGERTARGDGDEWAWFWTGAPGASARLALRKGSLLFEERSPFPPGERFGRVHFALEVDRADLPGAIGRLREHGVEVLMGEDGEPVRLEWMKAVSVYWYDPAGNLGEFWSRDAG